MADKDYVLGVAVQLQTESVAAFEAEVRRQLEAAAGRIEKNVKIRLNPLSPDQNAQLAKMLQEQQAILDAGAAKQKATNEKIAEGWKQRTVSTKQQIDAENDVIEQKLSEQRGIVQESADRQKSANKDIVSGWESRTSSISDQLDEENRIIEEKLAKQQELLDSNAQLRSQKNRAIISGESVGGTLIEGPDGSALEKQQRILDRYAPALNKVEKEQKGFAEQLLASSGAADHFVKSLGNIVTWGAGIGLVYGAGNTILKGFQDAIHSQQEQVVQGFYYQAQGQQFNPQLSQATMQGAINLATKYGDDVMKVQEAIGLWAKSTHGDLLPSLEMANEALKLNSVTGMNNEEIYRSTIGVLSQYHQSLAKANDLYNVGVGLATRYGGGIKMLGGEAQDMARQMIEAMDTSSAVAASFGLTMEQSAGMATALIHAGNYDSGRSAGEAISRSLAALERGKPEEAMSRMGIALHNNSQILDQLVSKWNQEVPGMGKSLGDVITSSVQSSALEPLKLMINQIGLVKQATQEAYEYEKSHPLDQMYEKMRQTDAFKLNQVKAQFEAVSIVIGRQFLPDIAEAADELVKIGPAIASWAPEIASLARGVAEVGAAWATWEVLKGIVGLLGTAAGQWKTLGVALFGESTIAVEALTRQQREDLSFLTNNAYITEESAAQWSAFAASQGVSIDTMIGNLARLKTQAQIDALGVTEAESSMSLNMEKVAAQIGVEEVSVSGSFAKMASAAKTSASEIGLAFIPVVGQLALFIGLLYQGVQAYSDFEKSKDLKEKFSDPNKRRQAMSESLFDIDVAKYALGYEQNHGGSLSGARIPKFVNSAALSGILMSGDTGTKLTGDLNDFISSQRSWYHSLEVGPNGGVGANIDQQLKATLAKLKKDFTTPPGFTESGDKNPTDPKAVAQALDSQSQSVKRNVDAWTAKIQADQKAVETARLETQYLKDHNKALSDLSAAYQKIISDTKEKIAVDQQALQKYEALASHAQTEPQRQKYLNDANKIAGELNNLKADLTLLQAKENADIARQNSASGNTMLSAYTREGRGIMGGLDLRTATLGQLDQAKTSMTDLLHNAQYTEQAFKVTKLNPKFLAEIQTLQADLAKIGDDATKIRDGIKSFSDSNLDKFQTGFQSNQFELSHILADPSSKEFARSITSATDQFDKFSQEWDKWESKDPGNTQLENVKALATAWYQSSIALAEYNHALAQAKASPAYAAVTALGNDVGSTLTNSVMGMFTQQDQTQLYALGTQIAQLQSEKNLLTGQNNLVERNLLDQKIKQLEAERSGIEDRMKHPSFLKQVQEDMVKSIMKGLTDEFTKSLQQAFLGSILPKQETVQDKSNAFINSNTTATQQNTAAISQLSASLRAGGGGSSFSMPGFGSLSSSGGTGSGFGLGASAVMQSVGSNSSSSAPSGIPGISSPQSISKGFGSGAAALLGLAAPSAGFGFMSAMSPYQGTSGGGGNASGTPGTAAFWGNGKTNAQHIAGAVGGLSMAVGGYDQGGVGGSLMSGLGTFEALTSMGVPPQIAIPIAGAEFLFSLFHPHYNASQNPDMFPDSGYAQGLANAQGISHTQANGTVQEDPGLKQQLGGLTELQYLNAWYNQYPGGQGLNSQGKQLWDDIGHITGNGKGFGVQGLHQGNVYVAADPTPGSPQVGESGNWQTVLQDIDSATQQLYSLENEDLSGKGTWISVNSYGSGGGGSATFNPFSTPGLSSSDVSSVLSMPYPALGSNATVGTSISPTPGSPSSGGGGYGGGGGSASPMSVTSNVYLNSDLIAQQVSSYRIQRETAGFSANY